MMKILDFFERNYFKFGISYLLIFSIYLMTSIIVPLNFFNANSYVTILLSVSGVVFGLYNILVKNALKNTKDSSYNSSVYCDYHITCCEYEIWIC